MNRRSDLGVDLYQRLRPWLPFIEWGFWPVTVAVNTVFNIAVVNMDLARTHLNFESWEPVTWEVSSSIMALVLAPAVIWYTRQVPVTFKNKRWIGAYALATLVWSSLHVAGMVAIRNWVYAKFGKTYHFGSVPREFFYEYLKDVRSFVLAVGIIESYRFSVRRLQGEASLLDMNEAEDAEPVVPQDRFLVKKLGREFLVAAKDIEYAQAAGNYVNLHVNKREYPIRSTIADIENRLDKARFIRVHRSYIVNVDKIASIEPLESGDARLHLLDQEIVPCSRTYRNEIKALIK